MYRKRITAALIATVLSVTLAGCSNSGKDPVEQATQRCVDGGVSYNKQQGNDVDMDSITKACLQVLKRDGAKKFVEEFKADS